MRKEAIAVHWGDYGWGMGFGWIVMLVFWVIVVAGLIFIVKGLVSGTGQTGKSETALDILKKRYARGEITHEEYVKARDELKKD